MGHLVNRLSSMTAEREQVLQREMLEQREMEELLVRSKDELQQLVSVVSQLHELQVSANEGRQVLPEVVQLGPERPRISGLPPFFWQPSGEYAGEFDISGEHGEIVDKDERLRGSRLGHSGRRRVEDVSGRSLSVDRANRA